MTKRLLSVILSIVILYSLAVTTVVNAAEAPELDKTKPYIEAVSEPVSAGEIAKVTFKIGNNPGLWGINFTCSFPKELSLVEGETSENGTFPKVDIGEKFAKDVLFSPIKENEFTYLYANSKILYNREREADLFTIYFKVADDADFGKYVFKFENYDVIDCDKHNLAFTYGTPVVNVVCRHTYTEQIVKQPTCTEKGVKKFTCSICSDSYTEEIDLLPHTEVIDEGKAETCTETGLTEGKHCSVCNSVLVKQEIVPKAKHKYDSAVITKQPTCTEKGEKKFTCTECKGNITEEIAPLGHSYNSKVTKKATCKTSGIKTFTCVKCKNSYTQTLKPTSHKSVTKNKKATYFAAGYKNRKVCSVCKDVVSKGKTLKRLVLKTPKVTIKAGKKSFKVSYKKVTGATGFQVKYKVGKKEVIKTFKTKKSLAKTIKSLKKGKYKVQVRAIVQSGKKKAMSKWSNSKTIKVR